MSIGKLYLVPNKLGESEDDKFLVSHQNLISKTKYFIFENEKPGRVFIKKITPQKKQSELNISILNKHTKEEEFNDFLNPCLNGNDIALISDAGCPGIADPGSEIVRLAHQSKIKVVPLVGPSSILLALMASGMSGQNFKFNGYLPIEKNERKSKIKNFNMEKHAKIVIIGGGFAGISLAKKLSKQEVQVVLLDKHNYHTFQPLLYQVSTGGLEPDSIAYPIRKILKDFPNFH
mgnify:CR=1 FL=1